MNSIIYKQFLLLFSVNNSLERSMKYSRQYIIEKIGEKQKRYKLLTN